MPVLAIAKRVGKVWLHIAIDLRENERQLDDALPMYIPQAKVLSGVYGT